MTIKIKIVLKGIVIVLKNYVKKERICKIVLQNTRQYTTTLFLMVKVNCVVLETSGTTTIITLVLWSRTEMHVI